MTCDVIQCGLPRWDMRRVGRCPRAPPGAPAQRAPSPPTALMPPRTQPSVFCSLRHSAPQALTWHTAGRVGRRGRKAGGATAATAAACEGTASSDYSSISAFRSIHYHEESIIVKTNKSLNLLAISTCTHHYSLSYGDNMLS